MIYLKIFGCFLIIVSSSLAGYCIKLKAQCRLSELENLLACIQVFENEIRYNVNDIMCSAKKVIEVAKCTNINLFSNLIENNKNMPGTPLSRIWTESVENALKSSCYSKEDIKVIIQFGNILGSGDVNTQLKNLDIFQKNIEAHIEECRHRNATDVQIYSKTGIYAGIIIVILLI